MKITPTKTAVFFLLYFAFGTAIAKAPSNNKSYTLYGTLIGKIASEMEWPSKNKTLMVVVAGEKQYQEIKEILHNRNINGKQVSVQKMGQVSLSKAQFVFVPAVFSYKVPSIMKATEHAPTIVVTENMPKNYPSLLNFRQPDGKLAIDINIERIKNKGIACTEKLKDMVM